MAGTSNKRNSEGLREGEKAFDDETPEDIEKTKAENAALEQLRSAGLTRNNGVTPDYTPTDFADALRHLQETGAEVVEYEGSPWHVIDKEQVVNRRFMIMGYRVNPGGDFGTFVSLMAVTDGEVRDKNGKFVNKVVINDGSTGIADQWQSMVQAGLAKVPMICPNGLRVSEYQYPDPETGELRPAKTFYIG